MGFGSYRSSDWSKLKESASITASASADQIFKKRSMDERFDPRYIERREALDSPEHPESTPIMIGLDVTGSMGYLSEEIAKNSLHETMMKLYSTKPVKDPQLLFAAIGDVVDQAPLQVTQFESDIRIAQQLLDLWLEGAGADAPEDFELLWYFAAKHTYIDSYSKRGKKGFLFTIGDADCHPMLSAGNVKDIFGDEGRDYSSRELLEMAREKYEVYHISLARGRVIPEFGRLLPGHVITLSKDNVSRLPEIIISVMQCVNGGNKQEVVAQWDELARPIVMGALEGVEFGTAGKGFVF